MSSRWAPLLLDSSRLLFMPGLLLVLAAWCAAAEPLSDAWLILLPPGTGAITTSTTRQMLADRYGAGNLSDQDIELGEGETEPGTVLFPHDPTRTIDILWKDAKVKISPKRLTIRGTRSRWKTAHGISLGTSLKQLEAINRRSFSLCGFGWDYSGTVLSWQGGALGRELVEARMESEGRGRVILRLMPTEDSGRVRAEISAVQGDRSFSSGHPAMQKLDPRIYEIVWIFP